MLLGRDNMEKLEHASALAARLAVEAFGEVHRDHHADETCGRALKRAADREEDEAAAFEQPGNADHRYRDEEAEHDVSFFAREHKLIDISQLTFVKLRCIYSFFSLLNKKQLII